MMKTLSLQDYQLISAYLDNACSEKERVQFEKRIKEEPELNQAFLEFKHTRRLLQSLPLRHAPRNFTLSGSHVPARPQRFFLAPTLNFVALSAAVLMVVFFAGSQFIPGFLGTQQAARSASPMASSLAATDTASTNAPMIITWGQNGNSAKATGKGGLGGGGGSSAQDSQPLGGGEVMSAAAPEAAVPPAEASPELSQAPLQATQIDDSNIILGIPAPADEGKVIATSSLNEVKAVSSGNNLLWVEIGLGMLTAICAVISFILRKKR